MTSVFSHSSLFKRLMTIIVMASLIFSLGACSEYEQVNKKVEKSEREADQAFDRLMPKQQVRSPLVVDQRPWYGSSAVPILNGQPLPAAYQRNNAIVMTFSQAVGLNRISQMIQSVTGIRVQVGQSVRSDNANARRLEGTRFIPVDAEEVTGGRFVWQGRLSDLLNQVADTFNADWSYDGRVIRFNHEITRTYMLHALATSLGSSGSIESGASDDTALPDLEMTSETALEIWGEIEDAVENIIGSMGDASFSPSTGTITVTGTPEAVRRVEQYLERQNKMRLRRVSIGVRVLNVTLANNFNLNFNFQNILSEALSNSTGLTLESVGSDGLGVLIRRNDASAPGGGLIASATEDNFLNSLQLSEQIERISIVHSGAVVTLSDQPAPLQVGRQIAYLERVSSTAGDAGGQVSLEPGTINEGLTMVALPRIVDRDRILLRVNIAITDAQEPFATFGQGGANGGDDALVIQLPEVETTGFLQNAVLRSGEMMVLAGFERNQDSLNDQGAPGGLWTGGERATNRSRNLAVLILTAQILPEEPMSILGR